MCIRGLRWLALTLVLPVVGCLYPVQDKVDRQVCDLAARPRDLAPDSYNAPPKPADSKPPEAKPDTKARSAAYRPTDVATSAAIEHAAVDEPAPLDNDKLLKRFKIPPGFPAGNTPPIVLPELKPGTEKERAAIIDKLYPPLPPVGPDPMAAPGPEGKPLTLADLQRLALANSPEIAKAVANIEAARGGAIQAGLYPNPTLGVVSNAAGTNGTAGSQVLSIQQLIKTANKLQLTRAAAAMDLANAELARRRAETDLAHQVRGGYFAVLVARENMTVSAALAKLTSDVYDIQVDQVRKGGIAAAYEPAQLVVQAVLAQAALVQARDRYTSAWKQLAATLGLPGMRPTELAGRIDIPIPQYDHEKVLARALEQHTDILTARNSMAKAQLNRKLAQVTPIPDVTLQFSLNNDLSGPPQHVFTSFQASIPIPIWDRNQGGIIQAQGNLANAAEQEHSARDALTQTLAQAFESYENNRLLLKWYRDQILPNQVRAYRGVYERYVRLGGAPIGNPPVFTDVVQAQQTLAQTVQGYIQALSALWQAVVDVADVMQTDDLFQLSGETLPTLPVCKLPELDGVPPLPCVHPCSPLSDPQLRGIDGSWPAPWPKEEGPTLPPPTPEKKEK
jgi:cobalt-zinc-cadmium efflux system outer membrane protein